MAPSSARPQEGRLGRIGRKGFVSPHCGSAAQVRGLPAAGRARARRTLAVVPGVAARAFDAGSGQGGVLVHGVHQRGGASGIALNPKLPAGGGARQPRAAKHPRRGAPTSSRGKLGSKPNAAALVAGHGGGQGAHRRRGQPQRRRARHGETRTGRKRMPLVARFASLAGVIGWDVVCGSWFVVCSAVGVLVAASGGVANGGC